MDGIETKPQVLRVLSAGTDQVDAHTMDHACEVQITKIEDLQMDLNNKDFERLVTIIR